MARPNCIELGDGTKIPILYEDRSVLAIDKPAGWMLVPHSWQKTNRNLQAAIVSSIAAGRQWARARGLKFLRYVHRLDAETSGLLLLARSQGAVEALGDLFESRRMKKIYLAVVHGSPQREEWTSSLRLKPHPKQIGRMEADERTGKEAETHFRVLQRGPDRALIQAKPLTGRTHQIRVHLSETGHPVIGDTLYGWKPKTGGRTVTKPDPFPLALRAVELAYVDPFTRKRVHICAPDEDFLRHFGFQKTTLVSDPSAASMT